MVVKYKKEAFHNDIWWPNIPCAFLISWRRDKTFYLNCLIRFTADMNSSIFFTISPSETLFTTLLVVVKQILTRQNLPTKDHPGVKLYLKSRTHIVFRLLLKCTAELSYFDGLNCIHKNHQMTINTMHLQTNMLSVVQCDYVLSHDFSRSITLICE